MQHHRNAIRTRYLWKIKIGYDLFNQLGSHRSTLIPRKNVRFPKKSWLSAWSNFYLFSDPFTTRFKGWNVAFLHCKTSIFILQCSCRPGKPKYNQYRWTSRRKCFLMQLGSKLSISLKITDFVKKISYRFCWVFPLPFSLNNLIISGSHEVSSS